MSARICVVPVAFPSLSRHWIVSDQMAIFPDMKRISGPNGMIQLSALEFSLVSALYQAPGRVMRYDQIIAKLWPGKPVADARLALRGRLMTVRSKFAVCGLNKDIIEAAYGFGVIFHVSRASFRLQTGGGNQSVASVDVSSQTNRRVVGPGGSFSLSLVKSLSKEVAKPLSSVRSVGASTPFRMSYSLQAPIAPRSDVQTIGGNI